MDINGDIGVGYCIVNPRMRKKEVTPISDIFKDAPLDDNTAMPGEVTQFKVRFLKTGHYVWHLSAMNCICYIIILIEHVASSLSTPSAFLCCLTLSIH